MLYPLKFHPILKEKIWGGSKLSSLFEKKSTSSCIGESFELSGLASDLSVVSNGEYAGKTIQELISIFQEELVGKNTYEQFGSEFPLLFKLIDANEALSIQVHPNDLIAKKNHDQFGKTEMWYIIDADPDAEIILGFLNNISKIDFQNLLSENRIESSLNRIKVKKGDVFFIPSGLIHAIGKGVLLAEIQQSSDLTYRVYDYCRKDENGNQRDLHIDLALEAISFETLKQTKVEYCDISNQLISLLRSRYFTTNLLNINQPFFCNYSDLDSFKVFMCVDGSFIVDACETTIEVKKGETVLIPASVKELKIIPQGISRILEVYI